MGVVITFTNTDPVPDPTEWPDWLTLGVLCCYTLLVVGVCTLMLVLRKQFLPLRTKNLPNTLAMCCFGIVQCWSTFVGNRHIEMMSNDFKPYSCSIVNFWLEYFVGLNGWYCVLYLRLFEQSLRWDKSYQKAFSESGGDRASIDRSRSSYLRSMGYMIVNMSSWPLAIVCILVTALNGSFFDQNSCHTKIEYKVGLAIWVLISSCLLAGQNYRNSKHIEPRFFSEYKPLNSIVKVGLLAVAINVVLNITGFVSYSWGRSAFTCTVCFMHTYTFLRLYGELVWKCLRKDTEYLQNFVKISSIHKVHSTSVTDLCVTPMLMDQCFQFCVRHDKTGTAMRMVDLYQDVLNWRTCSQEDRTRYKFTYIVGTYMHAKGAKFIPLPSVILNVASMDDTPLARRPNIFKRCEDWVLQQVQERWGREFFASLGESSRDPGEVAVQRALGEKNALDMFERAQRKALEVRLLHMQNVTLDKQSKEQDSIELEELPNEGKQEKEEPENTHTHTEYKFFPEIENYDEL